MAPLIMNLQ
jgi:hypothetical protein